MFKENKSYLQNELFTFVDELPKPEQKKIRQSFEAYFHQLVYQQIDEKKFEILYSEKGSRPNAPINAMVSALVLKEKIDWSYEELFDNIHYNLKTKVALGLKTLSEKPFCYATIFNFQSLVLKHFAKTGEHLIEDIFNELTEDEIDKLKVKTSIQRTDSYLAGSNVRRYGRLQLLVEVIIRFHRILSDEDKSVFKERFEPYIKDTSSQYMYHLKPSKVTHEMTKIGEFYFGLIEYFRDSYKSFVEYQTLEGIFSEHFTTEEEKINIIPNNQLSSGNIQSPDDLDATYRKKDKEKSIGHTINITETAHPENEINLVTDIAQAANNVNDSAILNERLDLLKEKTPDLEELHTDGLYGSPDNDIKCEELGITHVQTAIVGRKPGVDIGIEQISNDTYLVSCPSQKLRSKPTPKRNKVKFDLKKCQNCPHFDECYIPKNKTNGRYYFSHEDCMANNRKRNINNIPYERRKVRPNVEATVKEFSYILDNKKLKVRGGFNAHKVNLFRGIAINMGRIYRYLIEDRDRCARIMAKWGVSTSKIAKNSIILYFFQYFFRKHACYA